MLILDGLHYFNYTAAKFNHDVIQLPFWALAGFAFHRALRGGELRHWLLLGLAVGLSLWAKYFVLVLALPLALFLLIDRDARKALATPGPYVAVAVALIVMAPHLIWLVQNDFLPFAYAEHRALPSRGLIDHVWHPLQFALSQSFFLMPSLLIALPLFYPRRGAGEPPVAIGADAFDRRIVTCSPSDRWRPCWRCPRLSGRGTVAMWGYPLWLFLGVWLVLTARRALDEARLGRVLLNWAIVFVGARHRLHRQLRRAAALRSPLPRGVLPRRRPRPRTVATLSRRHRKTDRLCDRQHVGRRQCRALCAGASARADRRQAGARAVDRSRRSQGARRGGGVDRRRSARRAGRRSGRLPSMPRCSRRSCCTTGAAIDSINVGWAILLPKPSYAQSR